MGCVVFYEFLFSFCYLLITFDCGGIEGLRVNIIGVYFRCLDYYCICIVLKV